MDINDIQDEIKNEIKIFELYQNGLLLPLAIIDLQEKMLSFLNNEEMRDIILQYKIDINSFQQLLGGKRKSKRKRKNTKTKRKGGHVMNSIWKTYIQLWLLFTLFILILSQTIDAQLLFPRLTESRQFEDTSISPSMYLQIMTETCHEVGNFFVKQKNVDDSQLGRLLFEVEGKLKDRIFVNEQEPIQLPSEIYGEILAPICLLKLQLTSDGFEINLTSPDRNEVFAPWFHKKYLKNLVKRNEETIEKMGLSTSTSPLTFQWSTSKEEIPKRQSTTTTTTPKRSNILQDTFLVNADKTTNVQLVTASTTNRPWTEQIRRNHQDYCDRNRIIYTNHVGSVPSMPKDIQSQWLKIYFLLQELQKQQVNVNTVVWMDDDIVITSPFDFIRAFENELNQAGKHIYIATDTGDPNQVNTGIMLLRNTPETIEMLKLIQSMTNQPVYENNKQVSTLGTCPNQSCLHEQEAFNLLLRTNPKFREKVMIFNSVDLTQPHRNLNTMNRFSHYDYKRELPLEYNDDPSRSFQGIRNNHPQIMLNTCHASGMSAVLRDKIINQCVEIYEQNQEKIKKLLDNNDIL